MGSFACNYNYPLDTIVSFIQWKTHFLDGKSGCLLDWPMSSRSQKRGKYLTEHWSSTAWAQNHPRPSTDILHSWMKKKHIYIQRYKLIAELAGQAQPEVDEERSRLRARGATPLGQEGEGGVGNVDKTCSADDFSGSQQHFHRPTHSSEQDSPHRSSHPHATRDSSSEFHRSPPDIVQISNRGADGANANDNFMEKHGEEGNETLRNPASEPVARETSLRERGGGDCNDFFAGGQGSGNDARDPLHDDEGAQASQACSPPTESSMLPAPDDLDAQVDRVYA